MSDNDIESAGPDNKPDKEKQLPWERGVLEHLAVASLTEQRKQRRWGIFFKFFFATYLLVVLLMMQSSLWGKKTLANRYTALVEMDGVIEAHGAADADTIISGLRAAFESKATAGVILRTIARAAAQSRPVTFTMKSNDCVKNTPIHLCTP